MFALAGAAPPSDSEMAERYSRAARLEKEAGGKALNLRLEPKWMSGGSWFWFVRDKPEGAREYVRVDSESGETKPLFDAPRLAKGLASELRREVDPERLPIRNLEMLDEGKRARFRVGEQSWIADLETYELEKEAKKDEPPARNEPWRQDLYPPSRGVVEAPDKSAKARIEKGAIIVRPAEGDEFRLAEPTGDKRYVARLVWSPDSRRLVAIRVLPGERKKVYLFESTPKDGGPSKMHERVYDRPGDRVDTFDLTIYDISDRSAKPALLEPLDYGGLPDLIWREGGRKFLVEKVDRGYGRWRVFAVDAETGSSTTIVDDDPATFWDSTAAFVHFGTKTNEIVFRSERSGWAHLYLTDGEGGQPAPITSGEWVVRRVVAVDEDRREILFEGSGSNPAEDPYYIHLYRVNFNGSGLVCLSPEAGDHHANFSPDRRVFVDTCSTVTEAPVHRLRRTSDGKLLATLGSADIGPLLAVGWRAPEPFVAKGRDGKTDIYGLVFRPSEIVPDQVYPVIEDIYAGPQDSFVPKSFTSSSYWQSLAELGFVVVKIDGMGTRNRSKAFHDVAYKNLADAGLPDRILWIQALAHKYPYIDASRVGIFGTSAGGQSAAGALLFHPEFYKVGVASCGCHDNRLDKLWWNEQWMGFPVGPEYAASSNIDNAAKLEGRLMLIVGEMDDNVPPESTYRVADALIKAQKEFELVLLPGYGHTSGGAFGERKRRDFFVRNLLHATPPPWISP